MRTAPQGAQDEADRIIGSPEAAARVVAIHNRMATENLDLPTRERLAAEQRTIWEALFPETAFETIAALAH